MKIPEWLSHLRTDSYGRPVPFVPDFLMQNPQRQRESMLAGRCQVCARPVPWSRRFLVISSRSIVTVETESHGTVFAVVEPWLDERCAKYVLQVCPGLIRRTRADDLSLVPITSKRQVEFTLERGWFDGPLEAQSRKETPVTWAIAVPVAVPDFRPSEIRTTSALKQAADRALLTEYKGLTVDQKKELMRSWH